MHGRVRTGEDSRASMSVASAQMIHEGTDEALAAAAQRGDHAAYALLVARHREIAFAFSLARLRSREDAEDVVQEAFVHAYRSLRQYRHAGSWRAWLMRIVRNTCHDVARRKRTRPTESLDGWNTLRSPELAG